MRWNATSRPPSSQTAAHTLMLNSSAFFSVARSTRLAWFREMLAMFFLLGWPVLTKSTRRAQRRDLVVGEAQHVAQDGIGVGAEARRRPGRPAETGPPWQTRQHAFRVAVPEAARVEMRVVHQIDRVPERCRWDARRAQFCRRLVGAAARRPAREDAVDPT